MVLVFFFFFFYFVSGGASVEEGGRAIATGYRNNTVILSGNNRGKMGSMSLTMLIFAVSPLSPFLFRRVEGFLFFSFFSVSPCYTCFSSL